MHVFKVASLFICIREHFFLVTKKVPLLHRGALFSLYKALFPCVKLSSAESYKAVSPSSQSYKTVLLCCWFSYLLLRAKETAMFFSVLLVFFVFLCSVSS